MGQTMRCVVAICFLAFFAHAEEKAAVSALDQVKMNNYNMAVAVADQAAADEFIRYSENIDPEMAAAAEAAVAQMKARANGADAYQSTQNQEEELAATTTDSISLSAFGLMIFFVGGVLGLAVHRFRSSANKEAFIAGYSSF